MYTTTLSELKLNLYHNYILLAGRASWTTTKHCSLFSCLSVTIHIWHQLCKPSLGVPCHSGIWHCTSANQRFLNDINCGHLWSAQEKSVSCGNDRQLEWGKISIKGHVGTNCGKRLSLPSLILWHHQVNPLILIHTKYVQYSIWFWSWGKSINSLHPQIYILWWLDLYAWTH